MNYFRKYRGIKIHHSVTQILNFGKFEGKTIKEIIELQPSYIDWCTINLNHFFITNNLIKEIREIIPNFALSAKAIEINDEKWEDRSNSYKNNSYQGETNWGHYNEDLDMDQQNEEFYCYLD